MLQKVLHAGGMSSHEHSGPTRKAPFTGAFAEPSNRLELLTPSLPCCPLGKRWQLVAADCSCFRRSQPSRVSGGLRTLAPPGLHNCSMICRHGRRMEAFSVRLPSELSRSHLNAGEDNLAWSLPDHGLGAFPASVDGGGTCSGARDAPAQPVNVAVPGSEAGRLQEAACREDTAFSGQVRGLEGAGTAGRRRRRDQTNQVAYLHLL